MKLRSHWHNLNEIPYDAETVGLKLPQYCGSWENMAKTTEAAEIQLQKALKQLAWNC